MKKSCQYLLLSFILATGFIPSVNAYHSNPHFGEKTMVVRTLGEANASCFSYEQGHYQCACLRRQNDEKKAWGSLPAEQFRGLTAQSLVYLKAERCQ